MNKKKILSLLLVFCFTSFCFMLCGFTFFKKNKTQVVKKSQQVNNEQVTNSTSNDTWCITFQLVWNEFINKMNNGKPVEFVDGNPLLADELNKKLYSKNDISENSYYIKDGKISKALKKQIENAIYKKFKEKSDILDLIDWNAKESYLFYAMLKKDFNFLTAFDKLTAAPFNNSKELVKYFGVNKKSDKKLRKNIDVLFYNSDSEYAVKLLTKENEEVILFRTEKDDSFENLYAYIEKNTGFSEFTSYDFLKVPEMNVDKTISFDELCNKKIKNSDYIISQALQTIKFKMDNKGGSLKSEAALAIMKTALMPEVTKSRYFYFDKPFVMFLKEQNKNKPYYAMKINNTKYLVKE